MPAPAPAFRAFQQVPDPAPQPARAAWWVRASVPMAWRGVAWFHSQVVFACAPLPPPEDGPSPSLAHQALDLLGPAFDGELLYMPSHHAASFCDLLEHLVPAFLEGRAHIAWAGREWDIGPFNPALPAGHAVGWRTTDHGGLWVLCAQAGAGACLLGTALDVFGRVNRLEGCVLGTGMDAPVFDPTRACLLAAPDLFELLAPSPARTHPALAAFLHAGLVDGALGWPVLLAQGPVPGAPNPLHDRLVAFPDDATAPADLDEWMARWGAHPRLPTCPGVAVLGTGELSPARLWARHLDLPG